MSIREEDGERYRLLPNTNIFPSNTVLSATQTRVGGSHFDLYFDMDVHVHDRQNAVYVVVAMTRYGRLSECVSSRSGTY